jgi:hypothetical protein
MSISDDLLGQQLAMGLISPEEAKSRRYTHSEGAADDQPISPEFAADFAWRELETAYPELAGISMGGQADFRDGGFSRRQTRRRVERIAAELYESGGFTANTKSDVRRLAYAVGQRLREEEGY